MKQTYLASDEKINLSIAIAAVSYTHLVLVKASHFMEFPKVVEALTKE